MLWQLLLCDSWQRSSCHDTWVNSRNLYTSARIEEGIAIVLTRRIGPTFQEVWVRLYRTHFFTPIFDCEKPTEYNWFSGSWIWVFDSFEKYYKSKYSIEIQNSEQPLLDVDHTSARLNFLTPRYVNRKGVALPTSRSDHSNDFLFLFWQDIRDHGGK